MALAFCLVIVTLSLACEEPSVQLVLAKVTPDSPTLPMVPTACTSSASVQFEMFGDRDASPIGIDLDPFEGGVAAFGIGGGAEVRWAQPNLGPLTSLPSAWSVGFSGSGRAIVFGMGAEIYSKDRGGLESRVLAEGACNAVFLGQERTILAIWVDCESETGTLRVLAEGADGYEEVAQLSAVPLHHSLVWDDERRTAAVLLRRATDCACESGQPEFDLVEVAFPYGGPISARYHGFGAASLFGRTAESDFVISGTAQCECSRSGFRVVGGDGRAQAVAEVGELRTPQEEFTGVLPVVLGTPVRWPAFFLEDDGGQGVFVDRDLSLRRTEASIALAWSLTSTRGASSAEVVISRGGAAAVSLRMEEGDQRIDLGLVPSVSLLFSLRAWSASHGEGGLMIPLNDSERPLVAVDATDVRWTGEGLSEPVPLLHLGRGSWLVRARREGELVFRRYVMDSMGAAWDAGLSDPFVVAAKDRRGCSGAVLSGRGNFERFNLVALVDGGP